MADTSSEPATSQDAVVPSQVLPPPDSSISSNSKSPTLPDGNNQPPTDPAMRSPKLRHCPPYWHANRVRAKGRWLDREILEMVSTEFRDRSVEYYKYALKIGATRVNGKPAPPGTIIREGDLFENMRHRHEPPITSIPVKIVHRDEQNGFVVIDKPPSVPVHGVGRYYKHSLVEILKREHGIEKPYTVNRLDRLTSGCMFIGLNAVTARILTDEIGSGTMKKEYLARCLGRFSEEETTVDQPMLSIDRQMGLNAVHPQGKEAITVFKRLFYDEKTDTSVVHCRPLTGRTHQIRVHLQYIGYPIANDPIYADKKVWGPTLGKGGLQFPIDETKLKLPDDLPSEDQEQDLVLVDESLIDRLDLSEQESSLPPSDLATPINEAGTPFPPPEIVNEAEGFLDLPLPSPSLYPVDSKDRNRGSTPARSPSAPAKHVAPVKPKKIKQPKVKKAVTPYPPSAAALRDPARTEYWQNDGLLPRETGEDIGVASPVPLSSEVVQLIKKLRDRKDEKEQYARWRDTVFLAKGTEIAETALEKHATLSDKSASDEPIPPTQDSIHLTSEGRVHAATSAAPNADGSTTGEDTIPKPSFDYCKECFLPLWPDPKPSELYIYLHALRYSTSKWSFETETPFWAKEDWNPDDDE
ncbi:hypothetical protein FRC04_000593 [Tulasnella sp. 424]|nr:hypothetical protein FRC04_000593 [Tulasnella sp. 424]